MPLLPSIGFSKGNYRKWRADKVLRKSVDKFARKRDAEMGRDEACEW
jgi:hypothetical protein